MFNYGFVNTPNLFQHSLLHFCYEPKGTQIKKMESFTLHSPAPLLGFRFFVFSHTTGENPNTSLECGLETFTLDPKLNPLPGWSQSCLQLFLNGLLHFC